MPLKSATRLPLQGTDVLLMLTEAGVLSCLAYHGRLQRYVGQPSICKLELRLPAQSPGLQP